MNTRRLRRNRYFAWKRQRRRCYWCGERIGLHEATADHLLPRAHGGTAALANIVAACQPCNTRRGDGLVAMPKGVAS